MGSAVVAPIHTGAVSELPAKPATAIRVLSPNSARKIRSRVEKKMLRPELYIHWLVAVLFVQGADTIGTDGWTENQCLARISHQHPERRRNSLPPECRGGAKGIALAIT